MITIKHPVSNAAMSQLFQPSVDQKILISLVKNWAWVSQMRKTGKSIFIQIMQFESDNKKKVSSGYVFMSLANVN